MFHKDLLRDTGTFFAEHDVTVVLKPDICISLKSFGCRIVDFCSGIFLKEFFVIQIGGHIQILPVVHPGTFDRFFTQAEPQRLDQVKPCPCRHAGSSDVSCVCRYFRLMQYDIQSCHFLSFLHFSPQENLVSSS